MRETTSLIVIEDNPGDLRLIREAVRQFEPSVEVISFEDGPEAVAALCADDAELEPAMILLDLHLKTGDGLDVLRRVRFTPRLSDTPVVVFTSSRASVDAQRSGLLGAAKFLSKPLSVDDYHRAIREALACMHRTEE